MVWDVDQEGFQSKNIRQKGRTEGGREEGREGREVRKEGKGVMLKEAGSYEEKRNWK